MGTPVTGGKEKIGDRQRKAWEEMPPELEGAALAEAIAEKRKAVGAFLREVRRKKRIERGLPPVAEKRKHVSPDELRKIQLSNLRKGQEAMRARKAARLKHEAELRKQGFLPPQKRAQGHVERKPSVRTTLTYKGRTLTLAEWAAVTGFPKYLLSNRLAKKWPVKRGRFVKATEAAERLMN